MPIITVDGKDEAGLEHLQTVPAEVAYKVVVTTPVDGRYYKVNPADLGIGGSSIVPAVEHDEDYTFEMAEDTVLEYMTFKKNAALSIKISLTPGGGEIYSGPVPDAGPLVLMYYITQASTIYVEGIVPGTIVKTKIS